MVPVQVKVGTKFKEIATGDMCCFAIDTDGNLWKWGKNSSTSIPQLIQQGTRFSKVSAGKHGQCGYGSNIYSIRTPLML